MRTLEDVENYLLALDAPYEVLGEGLFRLIDDVPEVDDIIVLVTDPLVIFSVRLMKVPSQNREEFFKKLLELNATALVGGAYGVDGDNVILTDTLQLENLDFNEFQAAIESFALAIHDHLPVLLEYADKAEDDAVKSDK